MNGNDFFSSDSFIIFVLTIPLGIFFSVLYDIFRIKRIFTVNNKSIIIIDDILYMLICGIVFVIFAFEINNGIIRWYMLLNSLLWFFIYKLTIGDKIVLFINRAVDRIKCFVKKILKILFNPILKIIGKLHKMAVHILCKWKNLFKKKKKVFSFKRYWCRIRKKAKHGFGLYDKMNKTLK